MSLGIQYTACSQTAIYVYVKDRGSRENIYKHILTVQIQVFTVQEITNPCNVNVMKVRLCGLQVYADELAVVKLLDKLGAKFKSKILYEKQDTR